MPGMPFHLEKGHALMALEDLLNNPAYRPVLSVAFDGLRNGTPVGQVLSTALNSTQVIELYGSHPEVTAAGGLGPFVAGMWFAAPGAPEPPPYWIDYTGDVDGIVREALLLTMEVAWGVDRNASLPSGTSHDGSNSSGIAVNAGSKRGPPGTTHRVRSRSCSRRRRTSEAR